MRGPLSGLRVVVTRAVHQAEGLTAAFEDLGAEVVLLPLLEVVPPDDPRPLERAASELALYHWLVFTSVNAVEAFLPRVGGSLPPRLRLAAVGPATAEALAAYGVEADLVAERTQAEGLVELLGPRLGRQERILLPQAADARPTLAQGLTAAGAEAVAVTAYAKRFPPSSLELGRELFRTGPLGWVTFTSPSTVRHFAALFDRDWERRREELRAASIGPVTSAALRAAGVEPAAEAPVPREEALVGAIVRAVRGAGGD